jgi:hypothetical protein
VALRLATPRFPFILSIQERTSMATIETVYECRSCGKPLKDPKARWCSRGCWTRSKERRQRLREWRAKRMAAGLPTVPTVEEIKAACEEIQEEWTLEERIERMRVDQRPIRWEIQMVPYSAGGSPSDRES